QHGGPYPRTEAAVLRDRESGLFLLSSYLQSLSEPALCGVLSFRGPPQTRRRRHCVAGPAPVSGLALLCCGVPLQEDVLQLEDREIRKVHSLFPSPGNRAGTGLLSLVRGKNTLSRCPSL